MDIPTPAVKSPVTRSQRIDKQKIVDIPKEKSIATREQELETIFLGLKKRQGGTRASKTAKLWAQIIARLEVAESLKSIATELQIPYDTVKKYAQIATKKLKDP